MKFIVAIIILLILGAGIYLVFKPSLPGSVVAPKNEVAQQTSNFLPKELEVSLDPQNDSNQIGSVVLQKVNGKLLVRIMLKGEPEDASEPAHIHLGSCPNPGEIKYPLNPVVDGFSETVLDITGDNLPTLIPLAINVHKSPTEIKSYVACGDLKL